MAIVMTVDHGPGKGKTYIDDSCIVKTKEEVDRIIENISRIVIEDRVRQIRKRIDEKNG